MSSRDIELLITEKEKALKGLLDTHEKVAQAKILVERKIIDLENKIGDLKLEKKDLQSAISKSRHTLDLTKLEIKLLTSQFWAAKNSGG